MFWPNGWVCHAVRAPGGKWTLAAPTREGGDGDAIVSMKTAPVNQSPGPGVVSSELRVICMVLLDVGGSPLGRQMYRLEGRAAKCDRRGLMADVATAFGAAVGGGGGRDHERHRARQ